MTPAELEQALAKSERERKRLALDLAAMMGPSAMWKANLPEVPSMVPTVMLLARKLHEFRAAYSLLLEFAAKTLDANPRELTWGHLAAEVLKRDIDKELEP